MTDKQKILNIIRENLANNIKSTIISRNELFESSISRGEIEPILHDIHSDLIQGEYKFLSAVEDYTSDSQEFIRVQFNFN